MKSPLSILLDLPSGRRGFCLSLFSALARAVGIVLIAEALVRTIVGTSPVAVWAVLGLLGATLRGASLWADHSLGTTLSAANKRGLRSSVLRSLLRGRGQPRMHTAVTVTRGIDDLDDYFTTVVPALSAAAVVPVTLLVRIVFTDVLSAIIIAGCLPLVPVFMILIGRFTEESTRASNTALERLSDHLAELAEGLPVLIGLGRSRDHARTLRALGEKYHSANLATLRIAFLSSLALELIATISVALVAVVIGLRLVSGTMDLSQGLFILLLAPECFIPLRELGAGYHASENGRDAQERAHSLIASTEAGTAEDPASEAAHSHGHRVIYTNGTTISWSGEVPRHPGITAISGDSGAGKTTVLTAVAGNLPARATTTMTPHRVAFVPQAPRTFAATTGAELDIYGLARPRQKQALEAACLPADPEQPTSALSPGQLRRLAFVRVLHRIDDDVETLLLDEPTAHLDDENAEIVIDMIAEAAGRVRVVLASHDRRVTALADDEIIPRKTSSVLGSAGPTGKPEQPQSTDEGSASRGSATSAQLPSAQSAAADGRAVATESASTPGEASSAEPMPDEGRRTPLAGWTVLTRRWSILRSSLPLLNRDMVIALFSSCGASLAAIALTAVSAWLIVEASYQPPIMILLVAIVGVRFFGLSRSVLLYLSRLKLHSAIFGSLGRLRSRLWEHFETVGMGDRKLLTSDSALRSMVSDADDVRDLIPRTLFPPIVAGMVFIAVLIAAWVLDPQSLPMFLALGALNLVLLSALVIRSEGRLAQRTRMGRDRILSLLVHALNAKTDLRTNRADTDVLTVLGQEEEELELAQRTSARNFGASQMWLQLTTVGAALLIAVSSSAPTEILAVLVLMALALTDVFSQSLSALRQLPALGVVLDRLPDMAGVRVRASLDGNAATPREGEVDPFATLELKQMTVGWEAQAVVEDLDLRAERGRWTVLTGDSGSGKSTTLSVLLRFLDPWSGTYRAEDDAGQATDMLGLAPSDLAGRVAWCPQEAHIFRSTIRGNLAIARPDTPTPEEMYAALTSAGLDEWADPSGLELWVGDHGTDISGGQRQRLAVARTLLSGAEVIVLDEPTAHLDAGLAHRLMTDLKTNLDSHTVVMVTHDHSLVAAGDRVVDLGNRISPASSRT